MITRIWESILQIINAPTPNTNIIVNPYHKNTKKDNVILINENTKASNKPSISENASQLISKEQQQKQDVYKLVSLSRQFDNMHLSQIQKETKQVDEFITIKDQIDDKLGQTIKILQNIQKSKKQLQQSQSSKNVKKYLDLNPKQSQISQKSSNNKSGIDIRKLASQYKKDITDLRDIKYQKQLKQFPQISFDDYCRIKSIWSQKRKDQVIYKKILSESLQNKLTYRTLGALQYKTWLNDEVINFQIQMMERQLAKLNKKYRIMNSYFATTILAKSPQLIERIIKKKKIQKDQVLIMAINNKNHWYFVVMHDGRLHVFDSLRSDRGSLYYEQINIFQNAKKFAEWFYGSEFIIQVDQGFPQQQNGYDCGVFMLLGIRDVIRELKWTFEQRDIKFKRIQIANELINEQLYGF